MSINLNSLPPQIAWPIGIFIIIVVVIVGKMVLDELAKISDSPEVHKVINDSKEALDIYQEGAEDAYELQKIISKIPRK